MIKVRGRSLITLRKKTKFQTSLSPLLQIFQENFFLFGNVT